MRRIVLVAGHELRRHLRRPGFLISTALLPLILGVVLLTGGGAAGQQAGLAAAGGEPIGYVDEAGLLAQAPAGARAESLRAFADEPAAAAALRQGEIGGYYRFPADYLTGGTVAWVSAGRTGPQGHEAVATLVRAALLGNEPALAARVGVPAAIKVVDIRPISGTGASPAPSETRVQGHLAFLLPYAFAMILYVTIFSAGSYLLQSVTEEKENRTIEVVLTSLRPLELLTGKVLGLGLLGLVQVTLWMVAGALLLRLSATQLAATGLAVPWTAMALAIIYYILGYLIYGSLLGAVGATVTNVREGSQLVALLILPCVVPLWFLSAIIAEPGGALATALSLFPLTAPVTMMIRVPLTAIAAWEIALSVALLMVVAALSLWVAARLFRAGTLLAGQRLSPRAILRALRA